MNEPRDRCSRLALVAALPLGCAVGLAFGGAPFEAFVVGAVVVSTWLLTAASISLWRRGRELHESSGHWVLTLVAMGLPASWSLDWLEEMHAQLRDRPGKPQRRLLTNVVVTAPRTWMATWWVRSQHSRARRYRGDELFLVRQLALALAPKGDQTSRLEVLHASGLSRLKSRRSASQVPALALARNLLSTRSQSLCVAREHAHALLAARERAHLITRDLRRNHLAVWMRDHQVPYSYQYAELDQLRFTVQQRSQLLRRALTEAAPTYRTARHRRDR